MKKDIIRIIFISSIVLFLTFLLLNKYSLVPYINKNFFFSKADIQYKDDLRIKKMFGTEDQIIVSIKGDIYSNNYYNYIKFLSKKFLDLKNIYDVKSLSHGPSSLENALEEPLWESLLIANDKKSTSIVLFINDVKNKNFLSKIENIIKENMNPDYTSYISGIPYIIYKIKDKLYDDLINFTFISITLFSLVLFLIFRSAFIIVGFFISCLTTFSLTFFVINLLGIQVGALTANIVTISFILTISHIIFITSRYKDLYSNNISEPILLTTLKKTYKPALYSSLSTAIAFLLLYFSEAKPLRELGFTGLLASIFGFFTAFIIYPFYLKLYKVKFNVNKTNKFIPSILYKKNITLSFCLIIFAVVSSYGITKINTDPSLLSYFNSKDNLYKNLSFIDNNGGSSPLYIAIRSKFNKRVDSSKEYEKLWKLHKKLELNKNIVSIISLPLILTQANEHPLSVFLSWESIINLLKSKKYKKIANSFLTKDKKTSLFVLRMKEGDRSAERESIISRIKSDIGVMGYNIESIGGIYNLQSQMSKLLLKSIITGILLVIPVYFILSFVISKSLKISILFIVSILFIPLTLYGILGFLAIPIDLITAPSALIAIGLGVDELFHFLSEFKNKSDCSNEIFTVIEETRLSLLKPISISIILLTLGFSTFLFSNFPPTFRFSLIMMGGIILSGITSLIIFPNLILKFVKK